jgi:3-isopropylmalate/(R)-2-methylmalate dehydratase small subunit
MEPFRKHTGIAAALNRVNVDTDQIIPKQFLKRIERTGFGQFLFFDWRLMEDGSPNPDFELNQDRFRGASILVAEDNFGCGSSREHAPWALLDYGFKVIIAPSFADIFFNNCFKNGILPIRLPENKVHELFNLIESSPGYQLTVDLEQKKITDGQDLIVEFEVESFRREMLLEGLDEIGLTLQQENRIDEYEATRKTFVGVRA